MAVLSRALGGRELSQPKPDRALRLPQYPLQISFCAKAKFCGPCGFTQCHAAGGVREIHFSSLLTGFPPHQGERYRPKNVISQAGAGDCVTLLWLKLL